MLGTGVHAIDDDFDKAKYTKPLPTADDDEPDNLRELCGRVEGCWVRFKGAGLGG